MNSEIDEYKSFDASCDDDQFRQRLPQLPPEATDRQREIAAKYTRISFILVESQEHELGYEPDATIAWYRVGVQQFRITPEPYSNRDEASWVCWMMAKAIESMIDEEVTRMAWLGELKLMDSTQER